MNPMLLGGILGAVAAAGLLMAILATPPLRRPTLSDRIAPYLTERRSAVPAADRIRPRARPPRWAG